jgi:heptosyltransferase-1
LATEINLSNDDSRPRRVLIVRVGAMGDVLHALPAVAALRELHPDVYIGWAIEPRWLPLLKAESGVFEPLARGAAMPLVDKTYFAATRAWKQQPFSRKTIGDISSLRKELREERFDLCVDMQGSIRSAVIGRMAEAKRFAGPAKPHEGPARWLYGERVRETATHIVEQGCELLGGAVGDVLKPAKVLLPVDAVAEGFCDELLARAVPEGGDFVVIAPTAGWGAKEWPAERYGQVAAELARAGYRVLVNVASASDPSGEAVVRASGGSAVAAPTSLPELIALVRRAKLVIAGDTGPLHLAAALEIPVVGLFGPTDPARNGPFGTRSRVLRHATSQRDHSRRSETEQGLMQITADEVIGAALELLPAEKGKVEE